MSRYSKSIPPISLKITHVIRVHLPRRICPCSAHCYSGGADAIIQSRYNIIFQNLPDISFIEMSCFGETCQKPALKLSPAPTVSITSTFKLSTKIGFPSGFQAVTPVSPCVKTTRAGPNSCSMLIFFSTVSGQNNQFKSSSETFTISANRISVPYAHERAFH